MTRFLDVLDGLTAFLMGASIGSLLMNLHVLLRVS